ncbi:beta strand repeat-containing protein [Nitrospirillum iridis]|uniref:Uncharacterized protein n=1 Tax=Nitrospirillum iridis TaxID=765888 RepID=A0A7X0B138_9PROT|nr:hypothetical protein [Nitrospirillum iridis]MBB6253031.1 hypothetical protein [Nitrospirillum iridis]
MGNSSFFGLDGVSAPQQVTIDELSAQARAAISTTQTSATTAQDAAATATQKASEAQSAAAISSTSAMLADQRAVAAQALVADATGFVATARDAATTATRKASDADTSATAAAGSATTAQTAAITANQAASGATAALTAMQAITARTPTVIGGYSVSLTATGNSSVTLPTSGTLLSSVRNLADLGDPAAARGNLGLGSMATQGYNAVAVTGGTVSGTTAWTAAKIGLTYGGTNADLSATGGAGQVLKQASAGAPVTVGPLAASDISNGVTGSGAVVLANNPTLPGTLAVSGKINAAAGIQTGVQAFWLTTDGTGRQNWYWNTAGGSSPTLVTSSEDAANIRLSTTNTGDGGLFEFRSFDGHSSAAGAAITWTSVLYADLNHFAFRGNVLSADLTSFKFNGNQVAYNSMTSAFTFGGAVGAPTAAQDTNTGQLATTAYVLGQASAATPNMAGTASAGGSTRWSRGDHVHPTDTSRAPLVSPTFTGTVTAPILAPGGTGILTTTLDAATLLAGSISKAGALTADGNPTTSPNTVTDNGVVLVSKTGHIRIEGAHGSRNVGQPGRGGGAYLWGGYAASGSNGAGGAANLNGGNGDGSGNGGAVNISGGNGGATGTGGPLNIFSGATTGTGSSGVITLASGNAPTGGTGGVNIRSGACNTSGYSGPVLVTTGGSVEGAGGYIAIACSDAASSTGATHNGSGVSITAGGTINGGIPGEVVITGGKNAGSGNGGTAGSVKAIGGAADGGWAGGWFQGVGGTGGPTNGPGGQALLAGGTGGGSTGAGGAVNIVGGAGASGGVGGNVYIRGGAGTTRGQVRIQTGAGSDMIIVSDGLVNHVGIPVTPIRTLANLPAASIAAGMNILVSDRAYRPVWSNGTAWIFADGTAVT